MSEAIPAANSPIPAARALQGHRMVTADKLRVDIKTLARLLKAESEPPDGDG